MTTTHGHGLDISVMSDMKPHPASFYEAEVINLQRQELKENGKERARQMCKDPGNLLQPYTSIEISPEACKYGELGMLTASIAPFL